MSSQTQYNFTRKNLYDWLKEHHCKFEPLKGSTSGNAFKVIGPNGHHQYLDTPIDDTLIRAMTVYHTCTRIGVPVPEQCKQMSSLHKKINDDIDNNIKETLQKINQPRKPSHKKRPRKRKN